jgi:hypothetical protein
MLKVNELIVPLQICVLKINASTVITLPVLIMMLYNSV